MEAEVDFAIQQLLALEEEFLKTLESFRNKRKVLEKIKSRNRQTNSLSPPTAEARPFSIVFREAAPLWRLRKLVEVQLRDLRKSFHAELDQIMSCNYNMDLSGLFALLIGSVISSFQPVSSDTLHEALDRFIETGEKEDFRFLLFVGSDIDGLVDGQTALMKAVRKRNMRAVIRLVRWGAGLEVKNRETGGVDSSGAVALHEACFQRDEAIARFLLSRGANPNGSTIDGSRPLHVAAMRGAVALFDPLLSHGAEIDAENARQGTALVVAVTCGQREAAERLLDRGADGSVRSDGGFAPLHHTVGIKDNGICGHKDVAELLLSRGANVNARNDDNCTILHIAVTFGCEDVAELVLDAGVDIHAVDNAGGTAFHHVALHIPQMNEFVEVDELQQRKLRIAQMLVSRGINVHAVTNAGSTALQIAERLLPADPPVRIFLASLPPQPLQQQQQQ
uniref:Uncharacterized protein n=1 Tax=Chromera velia CCMP2878 TaxID=1169474 RepID=A0A0G4GEA4_9ALVE|eukprot:Cvel_21495.t1-p1 / transcript=Cvel_21495.t1 / gene=Cvel_21495 / organism=Chromera_velia_CCMP2878 / gene_product=Ankyrin-3, putative / transcript_product=Ankyrin-3, putative / location=Cvel_scaffold2021:10970-12316(-) / protein_length=449 / sequence_SO=supercontig / SO=protein_coding / is_pseudo=false